MTSMMLFVKKYVLWSVVVANFWTVHESIIIDGRRIPLGSEYVSEPDDPLPSFAEPLQNKTVARGRDVKLPCIIDNLGDYRPAWIRVENKAILTIQQQVISRNSRLSLISSDHRHFNLIIRNVQESDRGGYMCQVNTSPLISQVAYLDVLVAPDMIVEECSSDMTVREGANVTLVCKANGYPKPTISWRREDNEPIPLGSYTHNKKTQHRVHMYVADELVITRVSRVHMGAYLCIANNNVPSPVSRRIMLYVHFSPVIWCPQQLVGASLGSNVTLDCFAESFPTPSVRWSKDGIIINDSRRKNSSTKVNTYKIHAKIEIAYVTPSDYGFYKCIAENSLGFTEGSVQVYEVATPPRQKHQQKQGSSFDGRTRQGNTDSGEDEETPIAADDIVPKELNQRAAASLGTSSSVLCQTSLMMILFISLRR